MSIFTDSENGLNNVEFDAQREEQERNVIAVLENSVCTICGEGMMIKIILDRKDIGAWTFQGLCSFIKCFFKGFSGGYSLYNIQGTGSQLCLTFADEVLSEKSVYMAGVNPAIYELSCGEIIDAFAGAPQGYLPLKDDTIFRDDRITLDFQ